MWFAFAGLFLKILSACLQYFTDQYNVCSRLRMKESQSLEFSFMSDQYDIAGWGLEILGMGNPSVDTKMVLTVHAKRKLHSKLMNIFTCVIPIFNPRLKKSAISAISRLR